MTAELIAFTFGIVFGAAIAGAAFGAAYAGFVVRSWLDKRRGKW